ncbi:Regulator of rDNA transcription protein 14 [Yamadazyma tenuis]|uniref:Regulator of rDNA transcription 14 n=1 Tax=Candida tenuis (strain ATCC 10573 / BCRC 21748 / CBS 615 / JCM 9827 / NBRC 10315 / NRRL Y-1498 / VKM Y-70) TaxID=590646 RepID=G3B6Y7_CANTC|nr:uncharacterized protein CANTEDRAFT_93825 [Yamadazyma tenuis ATCC 10573]EGV63051.1 hypothetical protein CANTEDRAFT_93825 [Yamadazyma tenuis ATCC 10573]WEJ97131.1 Regulator of rDNA transcription protein 14 [Yamadazyma tenuis]
MFSSSSAKAHSANLISKLTASIHTPETSSSKKPVSSTELLASQFSQPRSKKTIKKRNKTIQKKQLKDAKELKRVKYELIRSKAPATLPQEHQKYLKKLVKRNKNIILANDPDPTMEDFSTDALQSEILSFHKPAPKKSNKFRTFKKKSVPGLTPGLAPVDYESDSE